MKIYRNILATATVILLAAACRQDGWSTDERSIISDSGETLRVLRITERNDSLVLRTECRNIPRAELKREEYILLAQKMIATVTSPEEDGVGIAGPQVGISRRIVAVQRFDKEGFPFEVYPNIRISALRGEKKIGSEGCLSIPDRRGNVAR